MRSYIGLLIVPCLLFSVLLSAQPSGLRCEYLTDPLGVDQAHPRFTWQYPQPAGTLAALPYQVLVATDPSFAETAIVWRSARTASPLLPYAGKTLQPFTSYYWKVLVRQANGQLLSSAVARFETGLLQQDQWVGQWISDNRDIHQKEAACFRKAFTLPRKIRSARVYISSAGLHELTINGQRVGDHFLDPIYTRFDRRLLYVTHDVTRLLQSGDNAIGVLLGNGWYNHQSTAVWDFHKAPWRARPAFCLDLRITYEDGTTEVIGTDRSWTNQLSAVTFNSIYTAEHYDARREQPGWDLAGFKGSGWQNSIFRSMPAPRIVSQQLEPIRKTETLHPVSLSKLNDTTWIYDLGKNSSGITKISLHGPAGTVVRLRHTELMGKDGHTDMSNIDVHYRPTDNTDPFQTDIITLSGKGEESFSPRFNYKGFQYVEVTSSVPLQLTKESLVGYFVHSDVPVAGRIHSSDSLLNKLWAAANRAYLSNLMGYPTDCPQREKNGWTGDAHIALETGLYNFDGITVYEKWLADHRDEQQPNGTLPSIIPTDGWGYEWGNGPDWTSTIAIIPWNIYLFYGDTSLLSACYDNIKRYVDRITRTAPHGLTDWGLGDWVPVRSRTPVEFTSTIYYYVDASILAKAAILLGKKGDAVHYKALTEKIKTAFNQKYLKAGEATYSNSYQTELSAALHWGLAPDSLREKIAATLAARVRENGNALDVGLLGTRTILEALSSNGHGQLAYALATRKTFPSWGWWIQNGATTLLENWDLNATNDRSMNHIMFGAVGGWLYSGLAGIRPDEQAPGFKKVILEPLFPDSLAAFEAAHNGPYGPIKTSWKRENGQIRYQVSIPYGSSAQLTLKETAAAARWKDSRVQRLPSKKGTIVYALPAGSYEIIF
ncbi:MAG: family 78 glycoside hydrolase catalytic domain [Candidatus Pseudobacter hemicellulosilyticus]|uniref:alpha-L-rhamnosidase n=1 Tax=Candidatus Pseudobacter hemicellulosilyticus TaxID=3121375 RepID=A0AAJ5WQR2_9BACT|nr:MAG: family 78 glycoside hydrolase catalytic domain [Pseudobacter sp.]